jgi:hypothetical protein
LQTSPFVFSKQSNPKTNQDTSTEHGWPKGVIPSALEWGCKKATIVHPLRGRIAFDPYSYQSAFLNDNSPRRLIVKMRQGGFSLAIAIEATHRAIYYPDSTILLVSRNQELAVNLLGYCYHALSGIKGEIPELVKQNESEIGFANGSRIKSLPANRSTGRGFAATRLYLDEYAFQAYAADIYRSVSPSVGHGGSLTVCSTPDGRANHFYQLWAGIEGGEWSRHLVKWNECPAYDQAWYDRERPKYTAQQWASEYECDFVASGQAVFNNADLDVCGDGWEGLQEWRVGRTYVTGWDIGRRSDPTVGITLDVTDDDWQIVAYERHIGIPYPVIQQKIENRVLEYRNPRSTYVESNGIGDPVIENLTVNVKPFVTTQKTKVQAITSLVLAIEKHKLKHNIPQLKLECQLYQWDDKNLVQDCVIAAAIATAGAAVSYIPNVSPVAVTRDSPWINQ